MARGSKRMRRTDTDQHSRKLVFLAFSSRPSRLRGESAVPHSPPIRKERKESANKNTFPAAKDLRLSSTECLRATIVILPLPTQQAGTALTQSKDSIRLKKYPVSKAAVSGP